MDDQRNKPTSSDLPADSNYANPAQDGTGADLSVSPVAQDAHLAAVGTAEVLPIPGQGLNEALHGNVQEGEVYYGEVGVDRAIDATVSHTFSEGHHPVRNPLPEVAAASDATYLDDSVVAAQGVAGATAGNTAAQLQAREQGAQEGDQRYALTPDTLVDAPQDLESEGRTGTEAGSTFQDSVYGAGKHDQSVSSIAEGPISQVDAPNSEVALGSFGMPGGQQIQGLQLSVNQPSTQGGVLTGSDGRPHTGGAIHVRGGTEDGFAYQNPDDHNPSPVEDIAGAAGERYIASSVAYHHGKVTAHLTGDNLNLALIELRSIGVKEDEMQVLQEGADNVINVEVDNLNRPYVEQVLQKYGK